MPFGTDSIGDYMTAMEATTLDALVAWSQTGTFGIAGGICLYGRNSGGNPPTAPSYRDATDLSTLQETYSCTGYGSPQALKLMADRHAHTGAQTFLARWANHYIDVLHRNMAKHGQPPGEDNIHEPHAPLNPRGKGDTDITRHHDAFGHCQILADTTTYQVLGGWTTEDAVGTARVLKDWVVSLGKKIGAKKHVREYLRWGNFLNTLAGIYDVFTAYGYTTEAEESLNMGRAAVYMMYPSDWSTTITGNVNTMTFTGWNYGELEADQSDTSYYPPFNYGWRMQTSQPWYDGHQVIGLYNLALRFVADSTAEVDATTAVTSTYFTSAVEANDAAFQKCVAVVDNITRWYAYDSRQWAPMGDQSASAAADFVNAKSHGCKYGTATANWIIANDDATLMSLADWDGYSEDTAYVRCHTIDYHEADGKYYELLFTDTVNVVHKRIHQAWKYIRYDTTGSAITEYDTNYSTTYKPDFEVGANNYLVPDMMWIRGQMLNDDDERNWARINMFDYLGYANSEDASRKKSQRLSTSIGWAPTANRMQFARAWHWAMQCGHLIRENDLAV